MYACELRRTVARISGIKIVGLVRSGRCEMRQRVIELLGVFAVLTVAALAMSVAGQTAPSAQSGLRAADPVHRGQHFPRLRLNSALLSGCDAGRYRRRGDRAALTES